MASQEGDSDLLERLYPLSTGVASLSSPGSASARAYMNALRHNYQTNHIFFKDGGFHNHVTHHVLAIYGLRGPPELIEDAYRTHDFLKPAFESPNHITDKNFAEHLGDERYYSAYLAYFSEYLRDHTPNEAFERFILSSSSNFNPELTAATVKDVQSRVKKKKKKNVQSAEKEGKKHPEMLNRLLAGLLHPFIHIGYGFGLGIPGQVAEGLASAAVHGGDQTELVPPSFFSKLPEPGIISELTSRTSPLQITPVHEENRPTFAFLRRIRDHPKLSPDALRSQLELRQRQRYPAVVLKAGDSIVALVEEWVNEWLVDARTDADVEKRLEGMVEEVVWGNVIWFAVGGWQARGDDRDRTFNADIFVAHLVTSSVFLLELVLPLDYSRYPLVPLASRVTLLKAYLATCAAWYISRGNGPIPIEQFYSATSDRLTTHPIEPFEPGRLWERIIVNAVVHPQEHFPKAVRSLAVLAAFWGNHPAGYYAGGGEGGLEGRETLDGTFFLRAAVLLLERLGRAFDSEELGEWDFDGYSNRDSELSDDSEQDLPV